MSAQLSIGEKYDIHLVHVEYGGIDDKTYTGRTYSYLRAGERHFVFVPRGSNLLSRIDLTSERPVAAPTATGPATLRLAA